MTRSKPTHFEGISNDELKRDLAILLYQQQKKVEKMAFLAPDIPHIYRVVENAKVLMQHQALFHELQVLYGPQSEKTVLLAALLSKIGFGYPALNPNNITEILNNRFYLLELLRPLCPLLEEELACSKQTYQLFIEALLRQGTFGKGTTSDIAVLRKEIELYPGGESLLKTHGFRMNDFSSSKYANPLTTILTVASEIDIAKTRLQPWQKNRTIVQILLEISNEPNLIILSLEKKYIELEIMHFNDHQNLSKINLEKKLEEVKAKFNSEIQRNIQSLFVEQEQLIKEKLRIEGFEPHAIENLFQTAKYSLRGMNEQTYLWYASAIITKKIEIEDQGHLIVIEQDVDTELIGNSTVFSYITNFQCDRLKKMFKEINNDSSLNFRVESREIRCSEKLWSESLRLFKGDTHMHLKMSVMSRKVWETIIGPATEIYDFVFNESQKFFNRLREKRKLPPNIDLKKVLAEANQITNNLYKFIKSYNPDYSWPNNKDLLTLEAMNTINQNVHELPLTKIELIKKDIELYFMLKFHLTRLFIFTEGSLPDFVDHFSAVSKLISTISTTDKDTTLKVLTYDMIIDAAKLGVWYLEPRFNISPTYEETLHEILLVIKALKEMKIANQGLPVPIIRLILSITKFDSYKDVSEKQRIIYNITCTKIFIKILLCAQKRYLEGNTPYSQPNLANEVTPEDVLRTLAGIDAAGQEEENPPFLFFKAYHLIAKYNQSLSEFNQQALRQKRPINLSPIGMTFHVAESIQDVSMESGIRHLLDAVYMKFFSRVTSKDKPLLNRIGHGIVIALDQYQQILGTSRLELVSERIEQINYDLKLLELGIPLLSVNKTDLRNEKIDLLTYVSLKDEKNLNEYQSKQLADIIEKRGICEDKINYSYDHQKKIIDIETRAGFTRDILIKNNIVVETNPSSNLGVSPFIHHYGEHTLKCYLSYRYGEWTKNPELLAALSSLSNQISAGDSSKAARAKLQFAQIEDYFKEGIPFLGYRVRVSIGTDDATLLGTNLVDEYYRMAIALNLSISTIKNLAEESIRSAIQPLNEAELEELKQKIAIGAVHLRTPLYVVGGLNEYIIDELCSFGKKLVLNENDPPIIQEGELENGHFYLILEGSVNVLIQNKCVAQLFKNELFGELTSSHGKRTATIEVNSPQASILEINKKKFVQRLGKNIAVRCYFENLIASRDRSNQFKDFNSHFGRPNHE